MSKNWPQIVRDLQAQAGFSEREIARQANVNRSTLRRFFAHKASFSIVDLERVLTIFGCELEAMEVVRTEPLVRRPKKVIVRPAKKPVQKPEKKKLIPYSRGDVTCL